jgi:LmbE family N-acetylglucosaminyl deacetylase
MRVAVFFFAVLLGISVATVTKAQGDVSVFFVPHQDDEMFMAGHIARDVLAGKEVYVVLVTNGSASGIFKQLSDKRESLMSKDCKFPSWFNCAVQSCMDMFTKSSFSHARNRELLASVMVLGVSKSHFYLGIEPYSDLENKLIDDGSLTVEKAQNLIETVAKKFGRGTYSTVYPHAKTKQHPDHKALGLGLTKAAIDSQKRFFYEVSMPGLKAVLSEEEKIIKNKALDNYFVWLPAEGRFSIGGHSVESMLRFWKNSNYEFVTTTYANN